MSEVASYIVTYLLSVDASSANKLLNIFHSSVIKGRFRSSDGDR